jgi:putative component of toxin-antitoxin plasmid stabilization module
MSKYGLPTPITRAERTATAVGQGVMAGGGGAVAARNLLPLTTNGTATRAILDGLSRAPVTQSLAGGVSTGAANYVGEEGGSPMAQLGAGLAAGMVVPGGGITGAPQAAGRYARSVGGAVVSPFTQAGREAIAGGVLNRLSQNPEQARLAMQNYEPTVPGSRATTAGASRDPGLMSAEKAIFGAFDTSGDLATRASANSQARIDYLDRIARDKAAVDWAKNKRSEVTRPMREEAFSNALQVQNLQAPIIREIDQVMAGRKGASEPVQKGMTWLRSRLGEAGDDPGRLYEVRKDVARMISGQLEKEYPGVRAAAGELINVKRVIDSTIESVAPGYQQYMAQFAKSSRPIDMMKLLQNLRSKSLASTKNPITDSDMLGAAAWTRTMRSMADEIETTLSPQQQKVLRNISADIDAGVAPQNASRTPGSDTIKNMSIANLTGRLLGEKYGSNATVQQVGRALGWLTTAPEDQVRRLLMDAMLDPVLARDLMSKATTTTVGNFSARLQERAKTMGIAGAASTGQAQARRDP